MHEAFSSIGSAKRCTACCRRLAGCARRLPASLSPSERPSFPWDGVASLIGFLPSSWLQRRERAGLRSAAVQLGRMLLANGSLPAPTERFLVAKGRDQEPGLHAGGAPGGGVGQRVPRGGGMGSVSRLLLPVLLLLSLLRPLPAVCRGCVSVSVVVHRQRHRDVARD